MFAIAKWCSFFGIIVFFLLIAVLLLWLADYFASVCEYPYVFVESMVITTDFCMFWRTFCFLAGEKYGSDSQIRAVYSTVIDIPI